MSCYYLIASLPRLTLDGGKSLLSPEDFKLLCREQLGSRDANAAAQLCDGPDYGEKDVAANHPFTVAWQAREIQIRNAIARIRAARRKTDTTDITRPHPGFDVYIEKAVENAFDLPTPLDREKALDHLRWGILDELAGVDPFAPSVALAYAVKLRLARRWTTLDETSARERVETALNANPGSNENNPL